MGSYDYVHLALFQLSECRFYLLLGTESAQQSHRHWIILHSLCERLIMLLGKDRGRHKIRNLFAVTDSLERSTDRHLSLAKSNVSAHQSVHDLMALHVRLDILYGL